MEPAHKKGTIFGNLDCTLRTVEAANSAVTALVQCGEYRMRPEDIARVNRYLKKIKPNIRAIESSIKTFREIAIK